VAKKPRSITTPKERPQVKRVQILGSGMLRIVLLAALAVGASIYGVVRHFSHPYKSMIVQPQEAEPEIEWIEDDGGFE
jgi:hypothetical protein